MKTWIDREGIRPAGIWRTELAQAIERAPALVFVLSPDSATSPECAQELDVAAADRKRIVPVVCRDVTPEGLRPELADPNWILARPSDDFEAAARAVAFAVAADYAWLDTHRDLLVRARQWKEEGGGLLGGRELRAAEAWLADQGNHAEAPVPDHAAFIHASRRRAARRVRIFAGLALTALAALTVLSIVALNARNRAIENEKVARSRELAARSRAQLTEDPQLALLLAAAAEDVRGTPQADAALRSATAAARDDLRFPLPQRFEDESFFGGPGTHLRVVDGGKRVVFGDGAHAWTQDLRAGAVAERLPSARVVTSADGNVVALPRGRRLDVEPPGAAIAAPARIDEAVLDDHGGVAAIAWGTFGESPTSAVVDVRTGRTLLRVPGGHPTLDASGRRLAVANGQRVEVYNVRTRKRLARFGVGNLYSIERIELHPTRPLALVETGPGLAGLWRFDGTRLMRTGTPSGGGGETHATFSPDGRLIATDTGVRLTESGGGPGLGGYRRVEIWDASTGDPIGEVRGHRTFVNWAAFDARGGRLVTAGDDRTVRVWGADKQEELLVLRGHEGVVYRAAFLPDGNVVSLASDGIRVWRVAPVTRRVRGTGAGISGDGSHYGLVRGTSVAVGDVRSAAPPRRLLPWRDFDAIYRSDIYAAVPSDRGDRLGVITVAVRLVDARSATLGADIKDARSIAFSASGSTAVIATGDVRTTAATGPPRVIATDSGATRAKLGRDPQAYAVAMAPDGRTAIAGYENHDAVIWRADGGLVRRLEGHTDRVLDVGFARATGAAITASRDGTARVWPRGGGVPVVLEGHAGAVMLAALSANGELALTAGEDGTVRVWDAQTGDLVETYLAQATEPGSLAFVGDSATFGVTVDGGVEIIDCEPCRPIERLRVEARNRSAARYTAAERSRLVAN